MHVHNENSRELRWFSSTTPSPFPTFFQRPRILRQGAIDLAFKNENIKKIEETCMVSVVK